MTDLVCKGDVRNRRWYVLAVVQEGDYTGVQRFHGTPVELQDKVALVLWVVGLVATSLENLSFEEELDL